MSTSVAVCGCGWSQVSDDLGSYAWLWIELESRKWQPLQMCVVVARVSYVTTSAAMCGCG